MPRKLPLSTRRSMGKARARAKADERRKEAGKPMKGRLPTLRSATSRGEVKMRDPRSGFDRFGGPSLDGGPVSPAKNRKLVKPRPSPSATIRPGSSHTGSKKKSPPPGYRV